MAEVTRDKILLTDAYFWNKQTHPNLTTRKIKDDIKKIDDHYSFDFHLCETNNQGHMIISDLRKEYHLKVQGITTAGNLKSEATIRAGRTLDKNKTVPWVMKFIDDGIIELPKNLTPGLEKGMEELQNYGVSNSGKYQALTGHDDFVSCLVILTHWAKRNMLKGMASKLIGIGSGDPYDSQKSDEDVAREAVSKRFEGLGISPDDIQIEFPS